MVPNGDTNKNMERLIDTYGKDVLRISYMYLKDKSLSEDAFQEVFIKIYKNYDSFQGKSSERTWIIRITINTCKDMLRSFWLRRVIVKDEIEFSDFGDVEQQFENKLLFDEVLKLPLTYKEVIILYYYQGFNTLEIGRILDVAEGTVRSRLHRAREILKKNCDGRVEYSG